MCKYTYQSREKVVRRKHILKTVLTSMFTIGLVHPNYIYFTSDLFFIYIYVYTTIRQGCCVSPSLYIASELFAVAV